MTSRPTISDYMARDVATLRPEMEINRAVAILLEKGYSGAPVVDGAGELVGVLSMKDCLRAALNSSYFQEWGGTVADYMSTAVETLDAELGIVQAAEHFLDSRYRRFPVTSEGRLIGQISRVDLLRALAEQW